jgi:hypothetical protein
MNFKIERNVPMTPIVRKVKFNSKYPIAKLQVNESFFVPIENKSRASLSGTLSSTVYNFKRAVPSAQNRKFVIRTNTEGARVWRVE